MKYCSNCGNELKEGADICLNCGVLLKSDKTVKKQEEKVSKGKGIASIILGTLGFLYMLLSFIGIDTGVEVMEEFTIPYKFGFALGFVLVQSIFATVSLCLALAERKHNKNGFNTAGLWLSIATYCLALMAAAYIFTLNQ